MTHVLVGGVLQSFPQQKKQHSTFIECVRPFYSHTSTCKQRKTINSFELRLAQLPNVENSTR